jgi:hypothetical protein
MANPGNVVFTNRFGCFIVKSQKGTPKSGWFNLVFPELSQASRDFGRLCLQREATVVYMVVAVQANVYSAVRDSLYQLGMSVKQVSRNEKGWFAPMFAGYLNNTIYGSDGFSVGKTEPSADHKRAFEEIEEAFGSNQMAEVVHGGV